MAGHSWPRHLVFCGSHAGISIGEDGPSQMGLEDLAMFRALAHSTVLYPCDAVSAERLAEQAARTEGIVYLRTTRGKTPVIYGNGESFPIGGSKVLRASGNDRCTVVAAGVTVHEALAAYDTLHAQGVAVRVIDAYSVKPLDVAALIEAAAETRGLVVVEDHWADGGLGDAVARAHDWLVPLRCLAVRSEPRSGPPEALLERHGISRHAIVQQVLALVNHPGAGRLEV
jgi:transketolase